jgi:hypothetical protein
MDRGYVWLVDPLSVARLTCGSACGYQRAGVGVRHAGGQISWYVWGEPWFPCRSRSGLDVLAGILWAVAAILGS